MYKFTLYVLVFLFSFILQRAFTLEQAQNFICHKIKSEFVETMNPSQENSCRSLAGISFYLSPWLEKNNLWFSQWDWSHLSLYPPAESDEIWESSFENIGVKIKELEGEFVVMRAHPESTFKKGDLFLSHQNQSEMKLNDLLYKGGVYKIERQGELLELKVKPESYIWDDSVELKDQILKVWSFRGDYFEKDQLAHIRDSLSKSPKEKPLFLDLRDNYGGNIAAGLKLLSLFICEPIKVGLFDIPSNKGLGETDYIFDLQQSAQVAFIKKFNKVYLRVEKNRSCFKGPLKVLINENTSSTSEFVAQALKEHRSAQLIGLPSSGRMVLSSWEEIPNLPKGYMLSYPYALYESSKGEKIEGIGVFPDLYKEYSLEKESAGLDSFLD